MFERNGLMSQNSFWYWKRLYHHYTPYTRKFFFFFLIIATHFDSPLTVVFGKLLAATLSVLGELRCHTAIFHYFPVRNFSCDTISGRKAGVTFNVV